MDVLISILILILAICIQLFLQLNPGIFALFYHYRLGKSSAKKADDLSLTYILGTEIFTAVLWLSNYLVITAIIALFPNFLTGAFWWIISGILLATAFATFCFYYRKNKGKSTVLFLPRRFAKSYLNYAEGATTKPRALTLGFYVNIPELIFALPLYLVSATILTTSTTLPSAPFIILYILVAVIPLFLIRIFYRSDLNLANIQRLRVELKPFARFLIPFCYLLLAIAVFYQGVL